MAVNTFQKHHGRLWNGLQLLSKRSGYINVKEEQVLLTSLSFRVKSGRNGCKLAIKPKIKILVIMVC
jgi:hypothetical protein